VSALVAVGSICRIAAPFPRRAVARRSELTIAASGLSVWSALSEDRGHGRRPDTDAPRDPPIHRAADMFVDPDTDPRDEGPKRADERTALVGFLRW